MTGDYTHQEIFSQPQAWQSALDVLRSEANTLKDFLKFGHIDNILCTGCGSTYYLALAAASLLQEQCGIAARGLPASEIWLSPRSSYLPEKRTLLIAISRSGETTETLRAVEAFRKHANGAVLTISCYPEAPLAKAGDVNLLLTSGQEQSIAQTRAWSVLYLATVFIAALWSGQTALMDELGKLSAVGQTVLDKYAELSRTWGKRLDIERFYFLGSAGRYGIASELSLKMKEMSLSHSEPFHFMEFRHGPQAMVTDKALIVGLLSETNFDSENAVLTEMRARGSQILSIGERDADVVFASGLTESARNILYLPVAQILAFERSIQKGLDPDHPHNLDAVVRLNI